MSARDAQGRDPDVLAAIDDLAGLGKLAARSAELRCQLGVAPTEPAPWLTDVVPDILAEMRVRQAEAEAHAAVCTDRPCERCERWVCRCGAPVDGRRTCPACSADDALAYRMQPTRDSVPHGFGWADSVSIDVLSARVIAKRDSIERIMAKPPTRSLLLMGPTGAGKTSLAVAMLFAWVRAEHRRRGALFVAARDLAPARKRYRLGDGEAPLIERAIAAPLLLLDDLGQESHDRDGCISDVVYGRADARVPTWITSGIDLPAGEEDAQLRSFAAALSSRYDGGFVRRVLESGKPIRLGVR